ncbi:response regulator [Epilithonimonas mollis]|uniref:Two component transcriptional regulator, LuxR family n=1 Tax=Epilithonimonas mollis TaxID=216903 RepID=A0A1M6NBY7_9FLAO|nr:response regulator transcription factor [Epilithonimonas mollis]SHJ93211.1 two component transcriptional regulator, LuxR family [Epilithonimonas mollis]
MKITVAIVEDEKTYSNTLRKIINHQNDLICVAQFFSGKEAKNDLEKYHPQVVLMDVQLQDAIGTDLVRILKPLLPETKFIMCTTFEDEEIIYEALKNGACGYLLKDESMQKITSSIRDAVDGSAPMSNTIAQKVLSFFQKNQQADNELRTLTPKEMEILKTLSEGYLYKEIADQKCISIDTVKKHIGSIYRKLHVANKIEAVNKYNQTKY